VLIVVFASFYIRLGTASAQEGWSFEGQGILFYTDDVGLFSATRRLSRDADPTQPAIDSHLIGKGSDMVFEPLLIVRRSLTNGLGRLDLNMQGQGYVFTDNPEFNHGTLRVQAIQAFSPTIRVKARYYYSPDQLLGENEERQSGRHRLVRENLTSHIWSSRLYYDVTPDLTLQLLGRYGLRRYNEAFSQRDTNFWTIGTHVGWRVTHRILLGLTYHYERGLAKGRSQPAFEDDTSYVNHYMSAEVDVELTERFSLLTAVHYELNNWTSGLMGDERKGAHEDIYQGEVGLTYKFTHLVQGFAEFEYAIRKQSFESHSTPVRNFGIGLSVRF
jgi:hypothetical protein